MTKRIESEIINSNVFVLNKGENCIIIDAGASLEKVENAVCSNKVLGIFLTHGHYDHFFYALDYQKRFDCPIFASKNIVEYLENSNYNYSEGKFEIKDFSKFNLLDKEGTITLNDFEIFYHQLGGHSLSDMCYQIDDEIFVGDVVIGRDMGRIDLFGGSKDEMKKSLEFLLKQNYQIMHSGHGEDNTQKNQEKVIKIWLKYLNR